MLDHHLPTLTGQTLVDRAFRSELDGSPVWQACPAVHQPTVRTSDRCFWRWSAGACVLLVAGVLWAAQSAARPGARAPRGGEVRR